MIRKEHMYPLCIKWHSSQYQHQQQHCKKHTYNNNHKSHTLVNDHHQIFAPNSFQFRKRMRTPTKQTPPQISATTSRLITMCIQTPVHMYCIIYGVHSYTTLCCILRVFFFLVLYANTRASRGRRAAPDPLTFCPQISPLVVR